MKIRNLSKGNEEREASGGNRSRSWVRFKEIAAGLACAAGISCASGSVMAAGAVPHPTAGGPQPMESARVEVSDITRMTDGHFILTTNAPAPEERALHSWFVFDKFYIERIGNNLDQFNFDMLQGISNRSGLASHPISEGEYYFLRNPGLGQGGMRYLGVVLRNERLESGEVADVVLQMPEMRRIESSFEPGYITMLWARHHGRILFRLEPGTLEPVVDEALARDIGSYAFQTVQPFLQITKFGGAPEASCIVTPLGTR